MKGSPGAILVLAIGAVFLSLGWTGRYVAVWEALRTGKSENASTGDTGQSTPNTDTTLVEVQDQQGKRWKVPANRIGGTSDGTCPTGFTMVYPVENGVVSANPACVNPGDLQPVTNVNIMGTIQSQAGYAEDEDTNFIILPTGGMGIAASPNARNVFNDVG